MDECMCCRGLRADLAGMTKRVQELEAAIKAELAEVERDWGMVRTIAGERSLGERLVAAERAAWEEFDRQKAGGV